MKNKLSKILRASFGLERRSHVDNHCNFLNEGCEYLDLELDEEWSTSGDLAVNPESIVVHTAAATLPGSVQKFF